MQVNVKSTYLLPEFIIPFVFKFLTQVASIVVKDPAKKTPNLYQQFNKEDMTEDVTLLSAHEDNILGAKYLADQSLYANDNTEFFGGSGKVDKLLETHAGKRQKYILLTSCVHNSICI